ncbi:MAG TPA: zinc-dependent alcohol dehydrogenase family protein [Caulifigura sp.]|nr:zinc-dependent alcohol dehydrogenase family protein [Caulifigura sp.]
MSRIVRFHRTGGPEVLQVDQVELPAPAKGEVRIAVKAIGLNRAEAMFRSGQYLEQPQFPSQLGYEASGVVEAVGPDVTEFKSGDAVSTIPAFPMGKYGVYGDACVVPAAAVAKNPPGMPWDVATSIWMQYLTAYGALVDIAGLKKDDVVLIPAASSSVGIAAIQICNMLGAIPIALTRTADKVQSLVSHGAKHVIATETQDVVAEVQKITRGQGARIAFDPVGGPMVEKLAEALATHGILFQYGALSTEPTPLPLFTTLAKMLTIRGYLLFEITSDPARLAKGKKFVFDALASGALKPTISKTFPLEKIVEAHRYLEGNSQVGKVVVTVG